MSLLVKSLKYLAEIDARHSSESPQRSVYILEILPRDESCTFQLYVGSTWHPVEHRRDEHGEGGTKAAKIFKNKAKPGSIRYDLMSEFPKFSSTLAAERAERRVALWLVHSGYHVYCNMLNLEER